MIAARVYESALILLLCISLLFKLALNNQPLPNPEKIVSSRLTKYLETKGFAVTPSIALAEFNAIHAVSGNCNLLALSVAPQGWQRDMIRSQAQSDDIILFVFQGIAYPQQPVVLTWLEHYRARLLHSLQMSGIVEAVVAIVASPQCDLTNMNWPNLRIDH